MHTSLLFVALMGPGAAPQSQTPETPQWQQNYGVACKVGQKEGKPLAVFIGSGPAGWEKVAAEGKLSAKARNLLTEHYICVYVDVARPQNKSLASAFEITGTGLILSTRDGEGQAFWHQGQLKALDLEARLRRHGNGYEVNSTETTQAVTPGNPTTRSASYGSPTTPAPSYGTYGNIGSVPAAPSYGSYGSFGSPAGYSGGYSGAYSGGSSPSYGGSFGGGFGGGFSGGFSGGFGRGGGGGGGGGGAGC